jgi:hypothetical protein
LGTWRHTIGNARVAFAATPLSALLLAILPVRVRWKRKGKQTSQSDHAKHFTHHRTPPINSQLEQIGQPTVQPIRLLLFPSTRLGTFPHSNLRYMRNKIPEIVFFVTEIT